MNDYERSDKLSPAARALLVVLFIIFVFLLVALALYVQG